MKPNRVKYRVILEKDDVEMFIIDTIPPSKEEPTLKTLLNQLDAKEYHEEDTYWEPTDQTIDLTRMQKYETP